MGKGAGGDDETGRPSTDLGIASGPAWLVDLDRRRIVGANEAALRLWRASTLDELSAAPVGDALFDEMMPHLAAGLGGGALVPMLVRSPAGDEPRSVDCLALSTRLTDGGAGLLLQAVGLRGELVTVYDGATGVVLLRNARAARASAPGERHFLDHFTDRTEAERLWRSVTDSTRSAAGGATRPSTIAASLEVRASDGDVWRDIGIGILVCDGRLCIVVEELPAGRPATSGDRLPARQGAAGCVGPVTTETDPITGLPGPAPLASRLADLLADGEGYGALMMIGISDFDAIVEARGEAAGCDLLAVAARRLADLIRPSDIAARLIGGRFMALMPGLADAGTLARRVEDFARRLSAPLEGSGPSAPHVVHIGSARWPQDGRSPEMLARSAEAALVAATRPADAPPSRRRPNGFRVTDDELRRAIDGGRMEAFFQPILGLDGGRVIGCEALARWNRPRTGMVAAGSFIASVEAAGLIWPLGDVILRQALRQVREWGEKGLSTGRIAVNIGAQQLTNASIVDHVKACLADVGLSAQNLAVEVTEAIALGPDSALVLNRLNKLHDLGVEIILDDFGTGNAALALLQRLPVNRLKIDRSVVAGLNVVPSCEPIIRTVTDLAHSLSLQVVAEGVETREQLRFLQQCGCDGMQGNLFAAPMPPSEATTWLLQHAHAVAEFDAAATRAVTGAGNRPGNGGLLN